MPSSSPGSRGVETTISDPNGQVGTLLDLLGEDRSFGEIAEKMRVRWPGLTRADVEEGVAALDAARLLEDAAAETSLPDE